MSEIRRIASGAPWEPIFGYSRAVRAGGWLAISGTTAIDGRGQIVGRGDMYEQARQAIDNLAAALGRAGMSLADVVRTRVFVTDITRFSEVARAHRECFGGHPPCSTIVEVRRLVDPEMLIEIEADAWAEPPTSVVSSQAPPSKTRTKKPSTTQAKAATPRPKSIARKAPDLIVKAPAKRR
ncbi:MAG: RidA family protein [Candidatus Binataceae bacterium]|nr:RidA family protein [Candidatus Binataceae bacterium]